METKVFTIRDGDQVVSGSKVFFEFVWRTCISLEWTLRDDNETNTSGGWYGDSCMDDSIKIHDDLILSVGWGDGFAVRRMLDNGTFENIYYDQYPANGDAYYSSITLDKVNKKAYVGNNRYDNLTVYDYSECIGGDDSVVDEGQITESGENLPTDEVGDSYCNGLQVVGDYLYLVPDDKSTTTMFRWKISTEATDNLTVTGLRNSGRYGKVIYDEDNNRLYVMWRENGEIWMVINPENASDAGVDPAKCYNIRVNSLGMGDDIRRGGMIQDKDNSNHFWVMGYYGRSAKIDITPILAETDDDPILLDSHPYHRTTTLNRPPYWMGGYQSLIEHPTYKSDMLLIGPDRDYWMAFGWLDKTNFLPVGRIKFTSGYYDDSTSTVYPWSNEDYLRFSYAGTPVLAESSGGNKYWIHSGYSWDGYKFRSWSEDTFPNGLCLETSGEIIFGTFSLDSNSNIGYIRLSNLANQLYIPDPSANMFYCYVSNDNGSTWELYDDENEENHMFSSTGYQARVKFEFEGTGYSAPHITGNSHINVAIMNEESSNMSSYKGVSSFNLRGR